MTTTDLARNNGEDRYLVSTGTPISDVLDFYEESYGNSDLEVLLEDLNQVRLLVRESTRRTIERARRLLIDRAVVADLIGQSQHDLLDEVWPL